MKKETKLTIETERVLMIRRSRVACETVCEGCGGRVNFITAEEAARLARVSVRAIYRMVEAGKIHFTETDEELLLICFNSLCDSLLEADTRSLTDDSSPGRRKS